MICIGRWKLRNGTLLNVVPDDILERPKDNWMFISNAKQWYDEKGNALAGEEWDLMERERDAKNS